MKRIVLPALTVMVAVVAMVWAAAWNRSGPAPLVITLTERELPMQQMPAAAPGEEPGVQLRIAVEPRPDPLDARNWLPESRLREIGFSFPVPIGSPQAADAYDNLPPRLAWVALEYDGPAWRDIERRRSVSQPGGPERHALLHSRLVPVDAGPSFEGLLARYPAGHLIVRAVVKVRYQTPANGGPLLYGTLREVVPARVAVPASLGSVFDGLSSRNDGQQPTPRYEVEIAIGTLGLPYVRSARTLAPR